MKEKEAETCIALGYAKALGEVHDIWINSANEAAFATEFHKLWDRCNPGSPFYAHLKKKEKV